MFEPMSPPTEDEHNVDVAGLRLEQAAQADLAALRIADEHIRGG
jgi:hypothetical protein